MAGLIEYVEAIPPIGPDEPGEAVYQRFQAEPSTLVLAVVDADRRPLGLVERNAFFLRMAAEHGRALYARRPIRVLMQPDPLVAEAGARADLFFGRVIAADAAALLKGFIVVEDGRYVGVGTALGVVRAGFAINVKRAEEMSRLAEDLAWAEAEASAASRAKSQFLAVMSHEIRTPLNGVLGLAEVIEHKLIQPELKGYLRTIIESGETLLRLLTDALDLSRAEAGTENALHFDEQPFALAAVARDIDALWRPRAEQAGLDFTVALDAPDDQWLLGDAVRLKQVLNNLVGNALKFTREGGVGVRLTAERDGVYVRLLGEVTDTGPGLDPIIADRLFEPFATGRDRTTAGAGLGLAICRQIVEAMHGRIEVVSEAGAGGAFRFEAVLFDVPPAAHEAAEPLAAAAAPEVGRVLVVDDNEINRLVAVTLLEMLGVVCDTARDGVEAVERTAAGAFDVVFMDIKMPRMGGLEALRAIRALPGPRAATPIIALTANADPDDAAAYLRAGFDGVVQKPIKPEALVRALTAATTEQRLAA